MTITHFAVRCTIFQPFSCQFGAHDSSRPLRFRYRTSAIILWPILVLVHQLRSDVFVREIQHEQAPSAQGPEAHHLLRPKQVPLLSRESHTCQVTEERSTRRTRQTGQTERHTSAKCQTVPATTGPTSSATKSFEYSSQSPAEDNWLCAHASSSYSMSIRRLQLLVARAGAAAAWVRPSDACTPSPPPTQPKRNRCV